MATTTTSVLKCRSSSAKEIVQKAPATPETNADDNNDIPDCNNDDDDQANSKQETELPRRLWPLIKRKLSASILPLLIMALLAACQVPAPAYGQAPMLAPPGIPGPPGLPGPPGPPGPPPPQLMAPNGQVNLMGGPPLDSNQLVARQSSSALQASGLLQPLIPQDEVCGLNMKEFHQQRIVGGRSASYAEVPFIVHLRESQLFRVLGYNKCGGVLINHRWALTAAHCKPAFFSSLEVILGKHKTFEDAPPPEGSAMAAIVKVAGVAKSQSSNEIDVGGDSGWRRHHPVVQVLADTVIVHPDYESKTLENDLALIKLKRSVAYREDIQPICLPAFNEDFTGLDGYATGWGLTDFDKRQLPDTLQIVRLPIMSKKRCQSMYKKAGHDKQITDFDLCAGYAKGGMDACEGDSGGPLIVRRPNDHRWTLAGIVSNGVKCGEPLLPGVYTKVSRFVHWIHEQMRLHP